MQYLLIMHGSRCQQQKSSHCSIIIIIIVVRFNVSFWFGSWKMWKGGGNSTTGNNKSYVQQPHARLNIIFIPTLELHCRFLVAVFQVCHESGCRGDGAARHVAPLQPAGAQSSAFSPGRSQPPPSHRRVLLRPLPVSRQQRQSASAVQWLHQSAAVVIHETLLKSH